MKRKKIIFGALFLLGGYWVIRNFLNKKVEAEKPELEYTPTETGLIKDKDGKVIGKFKEGVAEELYEEYMWIRDNSPIRQEGVPEIRLRKLELNPKDPKVKKAFTDAILRGFNKGK